MRDIQLHGIGVGKKPEGTAQEGDVLAGETFSNADEIGLTGTISRKTAQTYTPGTSNQTISAGQYLSEIQTILGDPDLISANIKAGITIFGVSGNSNVVDTSAGDAAANHILSGKKAYVDGSLVTGNIPSKNAATITPGTSNQTISANQYLSGVQTILGDSDLISGNIREGKNIFGVIGSLKPNLTIIEGRDSVYQPSDSGSGSVTISSNAVYIVAVCQLDSSYEMTDFEWGYVVNGNLNLVLDRGANFITLSGSTLSWSGATRGLVLVAKINN